MIDIQTNSTMIQLSVDAVEDALAQIPHLQPVHLDPSSINEAIWQTLIEMLPSLLVIHLKRFLYDPATGDMVQIGKPSI
jgi:ubiquitin carboxyl-terminal hydrolase 10